MKPLSNQQQAKNLWRDTFALGSIIEASRHLKNVIDSFESENLQCYDAFWTAFMVSYARPFSKNSHIGKITDRIVPVDCKKTHQIILDYRNGIIGHTDPSLLRKDGHQMHRLRFKITEEGILPMPNKILPHEELIPKAVKLIDGVYGNLVNLVTESMHQFHEACELKNGEYIFDFTQREGERFMSYIKDKGE